MINSPSTSNTPTVLSNQMTVPDNFSYSLHTSSNVSTSQNIAYVIGRAIGDLIGTTQMETAPLDYAADWLFKRLPVFIQNWYQSPPISQNIKLSLENAIDTNNICALSKLIAEGEDCYKALFLSIKNQKIEAIKFLLTQDIDIHKYCVYEDLNTAATPYQAALITTSEIKKLFKELDAKNKTPVFGPKPKNPWTTQFEEIIQKLANSNNNIEYISTQNEFGNHFYEPVINGKHYPLLDIIQKMDWQQVVLNTSHADVEYIKKYVSGYSISMNAFLKGEDQYLRDTSSRAITEFWLSNAYLADELNKRGYPEQNTVLLRGQSQEDRLVRQNHISFISTTADGSFAKDYQSDSPIVVFDDNYGADVTDQYYTSQTILYPTTLKNYQLFFVDNIPYHLAKTQTELQDVNDATLPSADNIAAQEYTHIFENLIDKIIRNPDAASIQIHSNSYGQIYYNIRIDGKSYDMYKLISAMDWSCLKLSDETLKAFEQSPYRLWDEQLYSNLNSNIESTTVVNKPIKLSEINQYLNLTKREAVPHQCGNQSCDYEKLYANLTEIEKGLIFQYTTISSKIMNSFLKGSIDEYNNNLQDHLRRWNIPSDMLDKFDINNPLQWWVYTARLINALNKIEPLSQPEILCRGQSHMDRHLRLNHPAPISFSPDLNTCKKYIEKLKANLILVNNAIHAKDITGLSFHPAQREFLHPPAFLNNYKKSDEINSLLAELILSSQPLQHIIQNANDTQYMPFNNINFGHRYEFPTGTYNRRNFDLIAIILYLGVTTLRFVNFISSKLSIMIEHILKGSNANDSNTDSLDEYAYFLNTKLLKMIEDLLKEWNTKDSIIDPLEEKEYFLNTNSLLLNSIENLLKEWSIKDSNSAPLEEIQILQKVSNLLKELEIDIQSHTCLNKLLENLELLNKSVIILIEKNEEKLSQIVVIDSDKKDFTPSYQSQGKSQNNHYNNNNKNRKIAGMKRRQDDLEDEGGHKYIKLDTP